MIGVFAVLTIRLWQVQILQGEHYRKVSENNRIRRIEIPAPRGLIYDRNGAVVLGNRPFYDLVYIPQYVRDKSSTLRILAELLHVPVDQFERMLKANRGRPDFFPTTLKRNLSVHEVSLVEANKVFLPGIEVNVAPRRDYQEYTPVHIVGYMGEITQAKLDELNTESPENPYLPGDLIGKQGLEARWESVLRGERGYSLIQVDAFGRRTALTEFEQSLWQLPVHASVPGSNLVLTIDMDLQNAVRLAFQGKNGAVVAMDPRNGEILAMVSAPEYSPVIYQEGMTLDKWNSLISDPYKPLFDKSTGGSFAPGSTYKTVVALAALSEGVVTPRTSHYCRGSFDLGRDSFHCHYRPGHGTIDLRTAMMKSCDIFFYNVGIELGVNRIAKYAKDLGLGQKHGIELNKEDPGLIPYNPPGKPPLFGVGDIPSIVIGQSANLLTPLQIASLYAQVANGGKLWRPHLVRKVINPLGESLKEFGPELVQQSQLISPEHFRMVRSMLQDVVHAPEGTGKRARVEGHTVAGKSGTSQVVALKKHRKIQNAKVSMKWFEHAIFAAFSPVEESEIVVAVVSENDQVGGGGAAAAPVAQKIIQAYWDLKEQRAEIAAAKKDAEKATL